jgi:hypothetical protein
MFSALPSLPKDSNTGERTYPTTCVDIWDFSANVASATPFEPHQSGSATCANMDTLNYVALSTPVSTIWPMPATGSSTSSHPREALPSDMLLYLDGLRDIKSIFRGIPINSCSPVHQTQTTPCYDIVTVITSRCTTGKSTLAASSVDITQCVATTDTTTHPRYWDSHMPRSGSSPVSRRSAQLLTYITGEPLYATTTAVPAAVSSGHLPLSGSPIEAVPASMFDAGRRLPIETHDSLMTDADTPGAGVLDDGNGATSLNVRGYNWVDSASQDSGGVLRTTKTEQNPGSATLPATSHSHPSSQETDSQMTSSLFNDLGLTDAGDTKNDDAADSQPPTNKQDPCSATPLFNDVVPTPFDLSQVIDQQALKSSVTTALHALTSKPLSAAKQVETLTPGGVSFLGSDSLSVLPDGSRVVLADGNTLLLEDGETTQIRLQHGLTIQLV